MQGIASSEFVDLCDVYDPRVIPTYGIPGTLFRYVPAVGNPCLLIKQDGGTTTNWINAAEGGRVQSRATSTNTTLDPNEDNTLFVHTLIGAVTVTFPAGQNGLQFVVKDADANASVNNITLAPHAGNTMEVTTMAADGESLVFEFFGTEWFVIATYP